MGAGGPEEERTSCNPGAPSSLLYVQAWGVGETFAGAGTFHKEQLLRWSRVQTPGGDCLVPLMLICVGPVPLCIPEDPFNARTSGALGLP